MKIAILAACAGTLAFGVPTSAFAIKAATDWIVTMPTKKLAPQGGSHLQQNKKQKDPAAAKVGAGTLVFPKPK